MKNNSRKSRNLHFLYVIFSDFEGQFATQVSKTDEWSQELAFNRELSTYLIPLQFFRFTSFKNTVCPPTRTKVVRYG
jgi:hypothetical protein